MSDEKAAAVEITRGVGATYIAALGSLVTSLVHSLQSEELLYGNMLALGTLLFAFYRMVLLGIDRWIESRKPKIENSESLKQALEEERAENAVRDQKIETLTIEINRQRMLREQKSNAKRLDDELEEGRRKGSSDTGEDP